MEYFCSLTFQYLHLFFHVETKKRNSQYHKQETSTVEKFTTKTVSSYMNSWNNVNFVPSLIVCTVETTFKERKKAKCNKK